MGKLGYDAAASFEIEDRVLAHLRVVAMNKLRRGESFMVQISNATGGRTWILLSPSMPLWFQFYGSRGPHLDTELLETMMRAASGPDGLNLAAMNL
uniref:DUF7882 family protein n=1 Tax=Microbacterium proteolyticum TaxID=1572644 RepID=UPI0024168BFB|nr:ATP-dependent DNA ligase [Microbacterium proteolyticum]